MYRFPTIREAKTHAKYLSRTLDLQISQAQEITAYQFGCSQWSELMGKCGENATIEQARYRDMFSHLAGQEQIEQFSSLIEPHLISIRKYIDDNSHVESCTLRKIANSKYHQISGNFIQQFLDEVNTQQPMNSLELIESLEYFDDTISRILAFTRDGLSNGHIEPTLYGISFYAYYKFSKKNVEIISREFDLKIYRPSKTGINNLSACSRSWFKKYMINYLRHLTQQLRSLGYRGTLRICTINGISVSNYYRGIAGETKSTPIYELFDELLSMGGHFSWSLDANGNKGDIGIEIPFHQGYFGFLGASL